MNAPHKRKHRPLTKRDLNALRREIARHEFLWIVDEIEVDKGFAVHDRRPDIGNNHGTWITSRESLDYLVRHGADAWCESAFNGGRQDLDVVTSRT